MGGGLKTEQYNWESIQLHLSEDRHFGSQSGILGFCQDDCCGMDMRELYIDDEHFVMGKIVKHSSIIADHYEVLIQTVARRLHAPLTCPSKQITVIHACQYRNKVYHALDTGQATGQRYKCNDMITTFFTQSSNNLEVLT